MRFWVLNYEQASEFVPEKPTLALRIYDIEGKNSSSIAKPLQKSPYWVAQFGYAFEDIDLKICQETQGQAVFEQLQKEKQCFTPELAKQILADFRKYQDKASDLLLHCNAGISRSPAVALALIEKFKLEPIWGNTRTRGLMRSYLSYLSQGKPAANTWVYKLLIEAV